MSLKEFDAKQFLLEKGEQAGLGVAVTLMVLMLIFSLFMPSKGFFSGSPAAKARELNKSTDDLAYALDTKEPGPGDKPEERGKGKLIDLDTGMLAPDNYATDMWFEPRLQEDKSRRPPDIYPVVEAVAEVAKVPIDIYVMRFGASPRIMVLEDTDRAAAPGGAAGRMNPFSPLGGGRPGGSPSMPPGGGMLGGGGSMSNYLSQMRNRGNLGGLGSLVGVGEKPEYKTSWISLDDWNPQQLTAHAILPMRMTIIAASFPYKKQLEEHQLKLRLKSLDDVLNEPPIGEGEKQTAAFDFRGVDVERQEVDSEGKVIRDWAKLPLEQSYQVLLEQSFLPFQPENPKYELVRPNGGAGLVMPLLREFDARKLTSPGLPGGFMPPGLGGLPLGGQPKQAEAPAEEDKSRYPDVADKLATIKKTLDDLHNAEPKQIAAPKFQKPKFLNAFNPQAAAAADTTNTNKAATTTGGEQLYPEHVLVRAVDVTVEPGKHYRYRLKMKMANPNYQNANVASPEYKEKEVLESKEWKELEQIVSVPQETYYYVVDEMQGVDRRLLRTIPPESAQYRLLNQRNPSADQVVFQFHRWVESTRQSRKDSTVIPVGEWAVADRVYVTRGEYVGRPVNVDLPVWKYNQNGFILPVEDQKVRPGRRTKTGIDVDFGQEPLENNVILVDFEGGRGLQVPSDAKKVVVDSCAIEVLMLSPEGKLLARNSTKDINDKERKDRREEVLKHILEIRAGK